MFWHTSLFLSKKIVNRTVLLSKSRTIHPMRSLTPNQAFPLMSNSIPILLVGSLFMELMAVAKEKTVRLRDSIDVEPGNRIISWHEVILI